MCFRGLRSFRALSTRNHGHNLEPSRITPWGFSFKYLDRVIHNVVETDI